MMIGVFIFLYLDIQMKENIYYLQWIKHKKKEIKVFNKIDSVDDKSIIEFVRNHYPGCVVISAQKGINISALKKSIENVIKDTFVEQELTIGIEQTKLASQIHNLAEVTSVKYNHDTVLFKFRANQENSEKIKKLVAKSYS